MYNRFRHVIISQHKSFLVKIELNSKYLIGIFLEVIFIEKKYLSQNSDQRGDHKALLFNYFCQDPFCHSASLKNLKLNQKK